MKVRELIRILEKCPKRATIVCRDGYIEGSIESVCIANNDGTSEVYFNLSDELTVKFGENDGQVTSR